MKSGLSTCSAAITVLALAAVPVVLAAQNEQQPTHELPRYVVKDLGTLGGTFSQGRAITNEEWIVGFGALPHNRAVHAFFARNGHKTDLGTLGGLNSVSSARPTADGAVVGAAETSNPDPLGEDFCFFGTHLTCLAFLWQNGAMTALPNLGGNNGTANAMNNRGQIAGAAENAIVDSTCPNAEYQAEPVIWDNGVPTQLPTVAGDPDGSVNWINDEGVSIGGTGNCVAGSAFSLHAVLWQNGSATDLGSLGGTLFSDAFTINNQRAVVGSSDLPGDTNFWASPFINNHAFLWQSGKISDLGTLPGDATSSGISINNNGQIVGLGSRAILWDSGALTDLNTLVSGPPFSPLYLLQAYDINDRSEIVGVGLTITGELHAFLAVPCDEHHVDVEECHNDTAFNSSEMATQSVPTDMTGDSLAGRDTMLGRQAGGTFNWRRLETPAGRKFSRQNLRSPERP